MFGTTGGNLTTAPPSSAVVVTEPVAPATTMAAPSAPLTVPQPVAMVAPTDTAFAQKVAASNAAEIELSRIAYVRAHSPEVRAFARQLLIDHREMAINLDNFALERGHLVVWQIEPEMASTIERLRTLDGAAFDRAYMDVMVEAHSKSVRRWKRRRRAVAKPPAWPMRPCRPCAITWRWRVRWTPSSRVHCCAAGSTGTGRARPG